MTRKEMETVVIDMNSVNSDELQEIMDEMNRANNLEIVKIAESYNCSMDCARDVWYLRTRSRWTKENEKELIRLHSIGTPPNICDWP